MIALPRHAQPTTTTAGAVPPLGQALRAAAALAATWAERRRQRRALLGLSDDMLRDIGLSRADVRVEGEKPFWRA
jgi:uncharacterized protein YjiS (DUF1127 family)